ncbi:hypothetical protein AB0H79_00195, partial [Micrococcus luteus]|uniref:hypothetical protein n=1 Tax=Micrococcus luteus TaxID=1270 RepID=UPI0033E44D6C
NARVDVADRLSAVTARTLIVSCAEGVVVGRGAAGHWMAGVCHITTHDAGGRRGLALREVGK